MLKGRTVYTTLDNREYHLLQIKDFIPYATIRFNKEDEENWVCCRQGESVCYRKFKSLREALIEVEIRGNKNIQKYLIFKDESFREIYLQMINRVDTFLEAEKFNIKSWKIMLTLWFKCSILYTDEGNTSQEENLKK